MHEVLAMFNIFYDDRGKGAERTVPVHIINFNFNFLKLISSLSLGCLHECVGGRGLPVISQQLKDRQIMIQNTRLGPFKNL